MEANKNDLKFKAFGDTLEALASMSKTAANLTEKKKDPKQSYKEGDTNNQQHQQTVEVHVGEQKEQPKPMIIREKPETHIHKMFPDNRALTKEECELEEKLMKLEYEERNNERKYRILLDEKCRQDRKEREENERKERLRKEEEQKKRRRNRNIIAGSLGAVAIGFLGYCIYLDARRVKPAGNIALPEGNQPVTVQAEGEVK